MATNKPTPSDVGGPCAFFDRCGNFVHTRSELCDRCVARLKEARNEFYADYDKEQDEKHRDPEQAFADWVNYGDHSDTEKEYLHLIDHCLTIKERRE